MGLIVTGPRRQLVRLLSDGDKTAGTWVLTSGTVLAEMLDETTPDDTTTQVLTPNTQATHTFRAKLGLNWDGAALGRPFDNTSMVLTATVRSPTSAAVEHTVRMYQGGGVTLGAGTLKDTWSIGAVSSATNAHKRRVVAASVVDAITDFTDLWFEFDAVANAANERGAWTYFSLAMGSIAGPGLGLCTVDFSDLTEMPRCFEQVPGSGLLGIPTIASGKLTSAAGGHAFFCHAVDLPADSYTKVRIATGYDGTVTTLGAGAAVRCNGKWVTSGTDNYRLNAVNDHSVGEDEHQLKIDGIAATVELAAVAFATVPNLDDGDTLETRIVGDLLTGWKNGVQILSDDTSDQAAAARAGRLTGFPIRNGSGATQVAIDYFETGSVPLPSTSVQRSRTAIHVGAGL